MIGKLVHYAFDAVLVSTLAAGVRRSSGFAPNLDAITDPTMRSVAEKYLGVGETIFDMVQGSAVNSSYFKRGERRTLNSTLVSTSSTEATRQLVDMSIHLSDFSDRIPGDLFQALVALNITTLPAFIFASPTSLFQRLPPGCTTLRGLTDVISQLMMLISAEGMTGEELINAQCHIEHGEVVTGVGNLDALVGGGFGGPGNGKVIEVAGDSGSGKTALALHIVLRHLSTNAESAALWVDTTGDLSPERLSHLLPSYSGPAAQTLLNRLHISHAFDTQVAFTLLENLHAALTTASETPPRIVIIDTITSLLGPLLSAVSAEGHAIMTDFMRTLRILAQDHSLSILVLNNSTQCTPHNPASVFASTARKPALGPSFVFLTDATLWLARPPSPASITSTRQYYSYLDTSNSGDDREEKELRVAEVFRSRISRSRAWCPFRIRGGVVTAV